jgi:glyoxylase-like metal-dependent hydrolase (beta-lactamase superfamily II)
MSDSTEIARGVIRIPTGISNAYILGSSQHWTLIDSGTEGYANKIRETAEQRFGGGSRPEAIVLTHGHFDHAGSAGVLAREWNVPIYAHRLEIPYLTGKSKYPPPDPTVGGFMSQVIRFFPNKAYDYGDAVHELTVSNPQSLDGWRVIETPGHTPGHVSFFREEDRVLIAGDAFCTLNQDSMIGTISKKPQVSRPPAYYTTNWEQAQDSVQRLADLTPRLLAAGHGEPMGGYEALRQLRDLAEHFPAPAHGRYVNNPPIMDESGVVLLPAPAPDPVKRAAIGAIAVGTIAAIALTVLQKGRRKSGWAPRELNSDDWRSTLHDESRRQRTPTGSGASPLRFLGS